MLKITVYMAKELFEMITHYFRLIGYVISIFVMITVALPIMGLFSGNEEKK